MNTEIRLGYQAALVSLASPTYGRLWLSVAHHPGDTVSSTQAEALVLAAEKRIGGRPRRRTELLRQRIQKVEQAISATTKRLDLQKQRLLEARGGSLKPSSRNRNANNNLRRLSRPIRPVTAGNAPIAVWPRLADVCKPPTSA